MQFKRRLKPTATVDIVPLIDVVFQLVVFFMVSSTFILTPGISLTLPEASSAEPTVMTRLVVTIAEEDQIYLNKEQYSLKTLDEALRQFSQREELREIQTVVVEGDQSVSYSLMVRVLDTLRQHGFEGVNLRMREED
ncbi:MAG: biopolymer transporter ExbD [Spirochaetaceae bacterium]|nr:biopolymer transporter ExbD [Spirochaetaceae bacterium]MCF7946961.1 biopolymer transporter ExbD [Spirochaetia bacterium]MCF7951106.1 biopolymer transporter ExbD [Spirochaetaceae bacterium]